MDCSWRLGGRRFRTSLDFVRQWVFVAAELPDIDHNVAYVVDDDVAVGPITLRAIAESISQGVRSVEAYVWWTGASDWIPFDSDDRLRELLPEQADLEVEEATFGVAEQTDAAETTAESDTAEIDLRASDESDEEELVPVVIEIADESSTTVIDLRSSTPNEEEAPLDRISVAEDSVLASVGARLEALAAATLHAQTSTKLDRAGAPPLQRPAHADEEIDLRGDNASGIADHADENSEIRNSTLETRFDAMVRQTVNHDRLLDQSERVRELLARACGAAISRQGFSVDRRNELRGHYYLSFDSSSDTRRIRLEISPAASVSGDSEQSVHVVMSWGRMAFDIDEALKVVHDQLPAAERRPGAISSDAELDTGSVSTRVELVWPIDDYIDDDYSIDRVGLENALAATQNALEQRWYELFIPAE